MLITRVHLPVFDREVTALFASHPPTPTSNHFLRCFYVDWPCDAVQNVIHNVLPRQAVIEVVSGSLGELLNRTIAPAGITLTATNNQI